MFNIGSLWFIIVGLFLVLLYKHIQLKKQIRSLSGQMGKLACGDTEKMLDISLVDKDLERLAGTINQYNDKQRLAISGALQHEERLKESVANISHDLRTPLTVILGHLQLLKKEDLHNGQKERIETALNKAERMKELVETFYDISVLDAGQEKPQKENFNFSNLLMDLITENSLLFEHEGIDPDISLPDHSVFLCSDLNMVERILQNLLTNAIRYSNGRIEIVMKQPVKDKIIFSIKNSVSNAMEIDVSRLFERFYTADQPRHNGGTGLGAFV